MDPHTKVYFLYLLCFVLYKCQNWTQGKMQDSRFCHLLQHIWKFNIISMICCSTYMDPWHNPNNLLHRTKSKLFFLAYLDSRRHYPRPGAIQQTGDTKSGVFYFFNTLLTLLFKLFEVVLFSKKLNKLIYISFRSSWKQKLPIRYISVLMTSYWRQTDSI